LYEQISRIIEASDETVEEEFTSREEALAAIEGMLSVMAKRKAEVLAIPDLSEQKAEMESLIEALQHALTTATRFKLKAQTRDIKNELNALMQDRLIDQEESVDDSEDAETE
ncbi:MAG: hypothetical protein ACW992_10550, partial [Candidatus Thorarchaeota archaeon]